jgi:hypothetical protein
MKLQSIWNWELWHKLKGESNLVKEKPQFVKEIFKKDKSEKSEDNTIEKNSNDDGKNQTS